MVSEVFFVLIAGVLKTNEYTPEFPFVAANCVSALRIAAKQHLVALQRHARPAAHPCQAPPAVPLAALRNSLSYHWKYNGSHCAALGTESANVHFWLEQIISTQSAATDRLNSSKTSNPRLTQSRPSHFRNQRRTHLPQKVIRKPQP
jgi:hypothetical protein